MVDLKHLYEYEEFERWFHELEGFGLRSERFFAQLDAFDPRDKDLRNQFITNWMMAAFDAGRHPEHKYI
jgi:hypothetical protein